ncbi:MAG: ABC transporter permease [Candidatus Omnitrophica bacterium]|nr:ABC transporter permease [Candidatus Omnitrophota bacterium]
MLKHILQRLFSTILLLLAVSFFTFWLMHATPGSFFESLRLNPQISQSMVDRYERLYHLNDPFVLQYWHWLINILHGEWGYSFYYNVPVTHVLGSRLFNTFILSFTSLVLTWGIGIPLGIWAALRRNQWVDRALSVFSFAAFSTPGFFLAVLVLYAASRWGVLPLGGMHSPHYDDFNLLGKIKDTALHLVIPAGVLSLSSMASLQRIMRGNMLGVLRQQYILAARARGLPEGTVIYRHALRNAFNPLVTLLGYEFAALLSGAALIEIVCSWPGLGSLLLTAVRAKDVYLVMSSTLLAGVLLVIGNVLADILLTVVDPRIRYEQRR